MLMRGRGDVVGDARRQRAGIAALLGKPATAETLRSILDGVLSNASTAPAAVAPVSPPVPEPAPVAPSPVGAVLDAQILREHMELLGVERVGLIVDSFLKNAPATLDSIAEAMAADDVPAIGKACHKLASGALTVGLPVLARMAKTADTASRQGDADTVRREAAGIPAAFADAVAALRAFPGLTLTAA